MISQKKQTLLRTLHVIAIRRPPRLSTHSRLLSTLEASVTVQDVLQTIHEDMKIPFRGRGLSELGEPCLERDARLKNSSAATSAKPIGIGSTGMNAHNLIGPFRL